MNDPTRDAAYFASVSGGLLGNAEEDITFERVVQRAVEVVRAADHCSLSLRVRRGNLETVAATSTAARRADESQVELDDGPCVDASFEREDVVRAEAPGEPRWQAWARVVADLGLRSVLSIRLTTETETLGALSLYASRPTAFDDDDCDVAVVYASHAATALSQARLVTGLQSALASRHEIGMAQGVLAVRYDLAYDQAFEVMRRYSNEQNVKLRDVARTVLSERALPE